ncbi:MAG: hypothetical protein GJ676_01090 [Rhodobacteraceae bacterium]|nr:hypothetical protein [Paracoccaceae bacterium]
MTAGDLKALTLTTLRQPDVAARQLMAMSLGRDVLWIALFLAVILSTAMMTFQNLIYPPHPSTPAVFTETWMYLGVVGIGELLFIYGIYLAGGWMKGHGSLNDIMVVLVWWQLLQVGIQIVLVFLVMVAPPLASLASLAAMAYGVYVLLHFISQAHQLNSLGRAAGVLVVALFAIAFALSLLIALVGGSVVGLTNV